MQVLQISLGISDAMAYLHDKSIVHRDLKPQNCLLVNERGKVKLCDFGLARLKRTAFVETVSNTAGTPAYQAPEMLRDEPISEKVRKKGLGAQTRNPVDSEALTTTWPTCVSCVRQCCVCVPIKNRFHSRGVRWGP